MQTQSALIGMFERLDHEAVGGWAADPTDPDATVELELLVDDVPAGTLPANLPREDLRAAGLGQGGHGFLLRLPAALAALDDRRIRLRRAGDGTELPGSPRILPRSGATAAEGLSAALDAAAALAGPAELEALIAALARHAAGLLLTRGSAVAEPETALIARWSDRPVAVHPGDGRPRALFIDEAVPDANRDAGSNAAISHMQALQRLGYRVEFVAAYGLDRSDPATAALEALGIVCWHAPWIASVEEMLRRLGPGLDLAYLHRFGLMQRYGALVRRWCPQARLLYCVADLHYLRAARRAAVEAGLPAAEASIEGPAAGLRTAELLAVLGADAAITHSSFERDLLVQELPEARVHLVPWTVPARPVEVPMLARSGVGFIGSYGHAPNLDAAHELVERIMPLVWAGDPSIPCLLAGSDLPATLRAAAASAPAGMVLVLGQVASAGEIWDRVRLSAAPLRYGAGLKGKVLDSLAAGVPCVCSPMAAEGMDLPAHLQAALVGDTAQAMADIILRLHGDFDAAARLGAAGIEWVGEALSPERIDAALAAATG